MTCNILTIDVEEYFHALNLRPAFPEECWEQLESRVWVGMTRLFDLLAKRGVRATFFVLGWVAERHPDLVRSIASQGHEVASHGMTHRTAGECGREGYGLEVRRSAELLAGLSGQTVEGFRASTFSVTRETAWVLDQLIEAGYRYDSSIFPVRHDRYGVADFPRCPVVIRRAGGTIVELPMLTLRVAGVNLPAGGGGYLRILPMALHCRAILKANRQSSPALVYLHPWELDPAQPRGRMPWLNRWRHYHNLAGTEHRLERLLDAFPFGTARETIAGLGALQEAALRDAGAAGDEAVA